MLFLSSFNWQRKTMVQKKFDLHVIKTLKALAKEWVASQRSDFGQSNRESGVWKLKNLQLCELDFVIFCSHRWRFQSDLVTLYRTNPYNPVQVVAMGSERQHIHPLLWQVRGAVQQEHTHDWLCFGKFMKIFNIGMCARKIGDLPAVVPVIYTGGPRKNWQSTKTHPHHTTALLANPSFLSSAADVAAEETAGCLSTWHACASCFYPRPDITDTRADSCSNLEVWKTEVNVELLLLQEIRLPQIILLSLNFRAIGARTSAQDQEQGPRKEKQCHR